MTTHPRDVVACPDLALAVHEPVLKQIAALFSRIAFPVLSDLKALPETHTKIFEHLFRLADMGIVFEPERKKFDDLGFKNPLRKDIDAIFKPAGVSADDLLASRTDKEKALEVREKTRAMTRESIADNDLLAMFGGIQRVVANTARLTALRMRNLHHLDAHAVMSSEISPFEKDDEDTNRQDILQILVCGLPLPDKDVSWEQIIEYRSDPNSLNRFLDLRNWISDVAHGKLTRLEAEQLLEPVLKRFHKQTEIHRMKTVSTRLEAFVTTSPNIIRNLVGYPGTLKPCFFAPRKFVLLEGEAPSEVSEVAFILETTFVSDRLEPYLEKKAAAGNESSAQNKPPQQV